MLFTHMRHTRMIPNLILMTDMDSHIIIRVGQA